MYCRSELNTTTTIAGHYQNVVYRQLARESVSHPPLYVTLPKHVEIVQKNQCSVSSHVRPTVLMRSASVTCLPLVKYPEAIFASISTRESGGKR